MKRVYPIVLLLVLIPPLYLFADYYIYDSSYGGKKVGRIDDDGIIYDTPYGGKKSGKVKDGVVYDSPYGGRKVGRIEEDGALYDKACGGSAAGRYEDGRVYDKPYGGAAVGRTEKRDGSGYWLLKKNKTAVGYLILDTGKKLNIQHRMR